MMLVIRNMAAAPRLLLLQCIALLLSCCSTTTVTINLVQRYGNVSQTSFRAAIAAAKRQFRSAPDDVVVIEVDAGTFVSTDSGSLINLDNVKPGQNGRLVIAGQGMEWTTLSTLGTSTTIEGKQTFRVTIRDIHFTRESFTVTQGHVLSAVPGNVTVLTPPGFPTPLDVYDPASSAGRFLRRYTDSVADPHLVVADGGHSWPPTANQQVAWMNATQLHPGVFALTVPPETTTNYHRGDLVCIKSKHQANAYFIANGSDVTFDAVKWTRHSRGVFRMVSNIRVSSCVVDRSHSIDGVTPCLATNGGGPQLGQPFDPPVYNVTVVNHTSVATGDDSVAFFNVIGGSLSDSHIRDSFARGVLLYRSSTVKLFENNVTRCPIWRTDHLQ